MHGKVNKFFTIVTFLSFHITSFSALANDEVLVEGRHLLCIKENIEAYKNERKNPLVIILPECPNPQVTMEIIQKYSQALDLGTCTDCSSKDIQDIISLNRDELFCLGEANELDPEVIYDVTQISNLCE